MQSHDHPTAEMVYNRARNIMPGIGMATVYRNLNVLVETGVLNRVSFPGDIDRFDNAKDPHDHAYCVNCKNIIDIMIPEKTKKKLMADAAQANGISPINCKITIEIVCDDCAQNN